MGTKRGAAGVRIELHDNSAYTVITTPKATAGIVGFAPKGELNTIQRLTSTAELDTYFGRGFNNFRYNQGLYAARAVLNAGGYVEYVRPYGEEIDTSDPYKRDLKTDTFVVAFDRDAMNVTKLKDSSGKYIGKYNEAETSLMLEYFASTRYKTDGAANFGVTRKINNIAEAVAKNSNVDFDIDASDYAELSSKSRGSTDMVLFALMGADPSIANRAYTSYQVTFVEDKTDNDGTISIMECATNPGFSAGSIVYAPVSTKSKDTALYSYLVTNVVDRKIFLTANDEATKSAIASTNYHPSVLFYHDAENAAADGADYLTVKTAVAGRGSKLFSALTLDNDKIETLAAMPDGAGILVTDSLCDSRAIRFKTNVGVNATVKFTADAETHVIDYNEPIKLTFTTEPKCYIDEIIQIRIDSTTGEGENAVTTTKKALYKVTAINDKVVDASPVDVDNTMADGTYSVTITEFVTPYITTYNSDKTKSADEIISEIANILSGTYGYAQTMIGADIELAKTKAFSAASKDVYVTKGDVFNFASGDKVAIVRASSDTTIDETTTTVPSSNTIVASGIVAEIDGYNSRVILSEKIGIDSTDGVAYKLVNLTTSNSCVFTNKITSTQEVTTESATTITTTTVSSAVFLISNYAINVTMATQRETKPFDLDDCSTVFTYSTIGGNHIVESSEKVLMDSSIGNTFVSLGLASIKYLDVNFTGKAIKVFDLNEDGEAIARLYMGVTFKFGGKVYEFEGTIVPYVYNNMQLSLESAANNELYGSGITMVMNDDGDLDMFREDSSYDLSGTVVDGLPSSSSTVVSFNTEDPAVVHDAVWSYNPQNNISTSTIATAYSLFVDKDQSDLSYIVGAGMSVNNFGLSKYETLNTTVIEAILNVCELRKDCFALLDAVNEKDIEKAIKKDILAARFPAQYGRWGAIYDARPTFYDSMVTLADVEVAPSIAMANLITANRSDSIFWRPPSGKINGIVPGAWCNGVKNPRKFNIPEDLESDIARLSDMHINAFRTNQNGMYVWGDYTMQQEDTAFNQIHVTMLIAGIHKIFYHYLDGLVFLLNTPALRSTIQGDLQAQLDWVTYNNPPGFTSAQCVCDDTNNTKAVINQNNLIVDLNLIPTKSTRVITLRTNVNVDSEGNKTITTTMV